MDENFPIIDENINPCGGCPDYGSLRGCKSNGGCAKPITHADRVRAMTDEELADWVWGAESAGRAYGPRGKKAWLDWLRQEAVE